MSDISSTSRTLIRKWSRPARLMGAGILALLLLIPLGMVQSVVRERHHRYDSVVADIAGAWSGSQTLGGPILVLPYTQKVPVEEKSCDAPSAKRVRWESIRRTAILLPNDLNITGKLNPQTRHRGIYKVQVYAGDIEVKAAFSDVPKRLRELWPSEELVQVDWSRASVSVGLSDPRGIVDLPNLKLDGQAGIVRPGTLITTLLLTGFHAPLTGEISKDLSVDLHLKFRGSNGFHFLPLGASTTTDLRSSWPDPSFCGRVLPEHHESSPTGFSAHWGVSLLNRSYPQSFNLKTNPNLREIDAGVRLFEAVTLYDKVTRSAKYGLLFICLSFLSLGLIEYATNSRLSLIQYLLIGMALALFFLLLIAFAEHLGFGLAYLIASTSVVLLNTLYCIAFLPKKSLALLVGALLASIYSILYIILQAEDYALLGGSLLLSLALAVTMYLTRGINRCEDQAKDSWPLKTEV